MKTFLLNGKKPIIKWGMLSDETYFEGTIPEGFSLAVVPSEGFVVVDIDRHGDIDGFDNVPDYIIEELDSTFNYKTKNNGMHYWLKYSGNIELANKASGLGIDLRVGQKGYVKWYPKTDPRTCMQHVKESSKKMNKWLEKLFGYV